MSSVPSSSAATLKALSEAGVAIWLDDLSRDALQSGDIRDVIHTYHVVGLTTNPAIFAKAISSGSAYAPRIAQLAAAGASTTSTLWDLMIEDVQQACDVFKGVYDDTNGVDGRVSLEVSPELAADTPGTVKAGLELWNAVGRDNLFIKVPATPEGLPAITELLAEGVSVNVTLIFGAKQYRNVLKAFCNGLEKAQAAGKDLSKIHSVASFFVSRVDSHVDPKLKAIGGETAQEVLGKAGLANARLAHVEFRDHETSQVWKDLAAAGANQQRPLWASTGVKDPAYPADMYVTGLATEGVVNTMPRDTLLAVAKASSNITETVIENEFDARGVAAQLATQGIKLEDVAATLLDEGVEKFLDAWKVVVASVESQMQAAPKPAAASRRSATSSNISVAIGSSVRRRSEERISELLHTNFSTSLAAKDATLWGDAARAEASKRLGWVDLPQRASDTMTVLADLRNSLMSDGLTRVVLCGMGGSSLAPEVMAANDHARLIVLDSTDPEQVRDAVTIGLQRTAVVISSKSGSTVETDSARRAFEAAFSAMGIDPASRMIAITDKGSPLDTLATSEGYRAVIHADEEVGGRYSALSAFGLVPAGLAGANVETVTAAAASVMPALTKSIVGNPGVTLGVAMGQPDKGVTKLVLVPEDGCPPGLADWVEQLVAESTGKAGTGILPVVVTDPGAPEALRPSEDSVVVRLYGPDANLPEPEAGEVLVSGSLGAHFQTWEFATAVSGAVCGVNPFDQPDVEAAKEATRGLLATPQAKVSPSSTEDGVAIFPGTHLRTQASTVRGALTDLVSTVDAQQGYTAMLAFVNRQGHDELRRSRVQLAHATKRPVTFGWGPRYLHSCGQFHKGGPAVGSFIVVTTDYEADMPIPGDEFSFGNLIHAQAQGDISVLEKAGRPVLRLHVTEPAGWNTLLTAIAAL